MVACAIDQGVAVSEVKCWGLHPQFIEVIDTPPLSNPYLLDVSSSTVCVADESGLVCWRYEADSGEMFVEPKDNLPNISGRIVDLGIGHKFGNGIRYTRYYEHSCLIDSVGLQCWG